MSAVRLALLAQLGSTLPLVGLIWLIQLVHYPLFARVGADTFIEYHAAHSRLITFIVAPLMLVELLAAFAATQVRDTSEPAPLLWVGLALAFVIWAVTMFVSVPQHNVLSQGFHPGAHALLVSTNWLRTLAWTARGALLLWLTARALR